MSAGLNSLSIPLTIWVFPVPDGPQSITGRRIPTSIFIQKVTEHVSGVGTVTDAIGVEVSYSFFDFKV